MTCATERRSMPTSQDVWFEATPHGIANEQYMVYMIPGNPCIMTYYQPFLSTLTKLLEKALAPRNLAAHVGGHTLPGYRLKHGSLDDMELPTSLETQVRNVEAQIRATHKEKVDPGSHPKIILVAHSIGTYITHEILRRQAEQEEGFLDLDVVGAILICAPVTPLSETSFGSTARSFTSIPAFPRVAGLLAKLLTFWLPLPALARLTRTVGRVPSHTAQGASELLKGACAVEQTASMLRDLCRVPRGDFWKELIMRSSNMPNSREIELRFYFAKEDGWVSSRGRDEMIAMLGVRGDFTWKVKASIDDNGMPHGFEERHSEIVADKVASMILDIVSK